LIVCGGGAHNDFVMATMANLPGVLVQTTTISGASVAGGSHCLRMAGEAVHASRTGNVATVTGAAGPRVLGAIYPR
jgi:anhydro-N-acetylmuramic acid kinase